MSLNHLDSNFSEQLKQRRINSSFSPHPRDLLQARILSQLFSQEVKRLVVKGGMAMRVAHEQSRHTKDIDLDADPSMSTMCLQKLVRSAVKKATQGGWLKNLKITEPKQTHTTARWKINGQIPQTGEKIQLTVEVSFRHHIESHEVQWIENKDLPDHYIPVYNDEILVLNKVNALLSDHRQAPRDVIDLFLLFRSGVEMTPENLSKCLPEDLSGMYKRLWKKLEAMDQQQFEQEILPVWDVSQMEPQWQDWLAIRLFVEEKVENLLNQVDIYRKNNSKKGC